MGNSTIRRCWVALFICVPAMAELLPGYELTSWAGLVGPANMPADLVAQINALTVGYIRELSFLGAGLGVGADVTVYDTSQDLVEYYGSPHSYHVFLRWRPNRAAPTHVH